MKSHNYNNPTGTDSEGPYWLNTETGEKLRWNGPMVGESNTYPPISKTPIQELIDNLKAKGGGMEIYLNANTEIINEALEKEKEDLMKAFSDGQETPINHPTLPHYSREEYYNDNYNQN